MKIAKRAAFALALVFTLTLPAICVEQEANAAEDLRSAAESIIKETAVTGHGDHCVGHTHLEAVSVQVYAPEFEAVEHGDHCVGHIHLDAELILPDASEIDANVIDGDDVMIDSTAASSHTHALKIVSGRDCTYVNPSQHMSFILKTEICTVSGCNYFYMWKEDPVYSSHSSTFVDKGHTGSSSTHNYEYYCSTCKSTLSTGSYQCPPTGCITINSIPEEID